MTRAFGVRGCRYRMVATPGHRTHAVEPQRVRIARFGHRDGVDEFDTITVDVAGTTVFGCRGGSAGPAVLLLHGFPETHLMWRDIAPRLAAASTVVCVDLPGYGASGCPASDDEHGPYSKRAMAAMLVAVMRRLGHERFAVVGHDRGGRVAYRMALDHPDVITSVAVLDVVPVLDAWELADDRLALGFWPWSLLAQPAPLPERLIVAAPDAVITDALAGWGSASSSFPADVRAAYVEALSDADHVHAICEEYRAAATIDRDHDRADRAAGHRIDCPVLVLWSAGSALDTWYDEQGGPLGIWRRWADDVTGSAVKGGHFFPEEHPQSTARYLRTFLTTTET
jgi:haloacetate dehalogenase